MKTAILDADNRVVNVFSADPADVVAPDGHTKQGFTDSVYVPRHHVWNGSEFVADDVTLAIGAARVAASSLASTPRASSDLEERVATLETVVGVNDE